VTTRGFGVAEMRAIGAWIAEVLRDPDDTATIQRVRVRAGELSAGFPLPGVRERADVR
jgi:glycine hydroxymethyltransferase